MSHINSFRRGGRAVFLIALVSLLIVANLSVSAVAQVSVIAPIARLPGQSWVLTATGKRVIRWDVIFNNTVYSVEGDKLELPLTMPVATESGEAPLEIAAVLSNGEIERVERTVSLGTARDALIAEWIAIIQSEDGTMRKSNSTNAPGQCKRYLINTFARASEQYMMACAPTEPLAMPDEPNPKDGARVPGCAWVLPSPFSGNPFYLADSYDYNPSATVRENKAAVIDMLESVQPGDVLQLMGVFSNGARGTHTLLVTDGYDPETGLLHWADSNFRVRLIDDVRYGIVEADQARDIEEVAGWLAQSNCGASVYRLSQDVALRPDVYLNASAGSTP